MNNMASPSDPGPAQDHADARHASPFKNLHACEPSCLSMFSSLPKQPRRKRPGFSTSRLHSVHAPQAQKRAGSTAATHTFNMAVNLILTWSQTKDPSFLKITQTLANLRFTSSSVSSSAGLLWRGHCWDMWSAPLTSTSGHSQQWMVQFAYLVSRQVQYPSPPLEIVSP